MPLNDQRDAGCKDDVLSPVKVDGYDTNYVLIATYIHFV